MVCPFVKKTTKLRIADFVHGADGLGNQNFPSPKGRQIDQSAPAFLVEQANLNPGKVTLVALGPLTNIALVGFFLGWSPTVWMILWLVDDPNFCLILEQAIQLDPEFSKKIGQIVVLGGAFLVNGNVNPAAEANVCLL